METMRRGHVGVKVNDSVGHFFKTFKGLRQGDSLSPLLFDLAVDALAMIMDKARIEGYIKGSSLIFMTME